MPVQRNPTGEAARLSKLAADLQTKQVNVGWLESAKYPDGTPVAYVAAIQEFGTDKIPPRPFLRPTVEAQADKWGKITRKLAKTATNAGDMLEVVGAVIAGDMREAIAAVTEPPLSSATLAGRESRGNSSKKPLVDTRVMQPTLTHVVTSVTKD